MPYKSKAQQRFMHAAAERGEVSKATVAKFDEATKHAKGGFEKLPEKKELKHGKDGSHQDSHKKMGGSRGKIVTGSPEEQ